MALRQFSVMCMIISFTLIVGDVSFGQKINLNIANAWHAVKNNTAITDTSYSTINKLKKTETATTSFTNEAYIHLVSGDSTGTQIVKIKKNGNTLSNPKVKRTFTVGANADHIVTISFDAIRTSSGKCVPVFNAKENNNFYNEADAISAKITLSVGSINLFTADATNNILTAVNSQLAGVATLNCGHFPTGSIGKANVVITNLVASTISIVYSLDIQAYGENGSLIFMDNNAVNVGNAPAGNYDNDILITVGLTNTYSFTTTDKYTTNASF